MARRRTRRMKLTARSRVELGPESPAKQVQSKTANDHYFGKDLIKSLVIIVAVLALELGWWLLHR